MAESCASERRIERNSGTTTTLFLPIEDQRREPSGPRLYLDLIGSEAGRESLVRSPNSLLQNGSLRCAAHSCLNVFYSTVICVKSR